MSVDSSEVLTQVIRINRNIVECKFDLCYCTVIQKLELIETLWNVNYNGYPVHLILLRINRNIVECKSFSNILLILPSSRINRNIVECKSVDGVTLALKGGRINRNIVECKC